MQSAHRQLSASDHHSKFKGGSFPPLEREGTGAGEDRSFLSKAGRGQLGEPVRSWGNVMDSLLSSFKYGSSSLPCRHCLPRPPSPVDA